MISRLVFCFETTGVPPPGVRTWKTSKGLVWVVEADNTKIILSSGQTITKKTAGETADIVEMNYKLGNLE